MYDYRNDVGKWLDYHQFRSPQQALRQLMQYVEFGEDNDGQIVIYTNLTFQESNGRGEIRSGVRDNERVVDMDTLESV